MPNSHKVTSYDEILANLRRLCGEQRTGTLFITTDDNHAARFVLEDGKIITIGYSQLHGYDALPRIQQMKGGSYRFVDGGFISMEEVPMPDTDELLSMLKEGDHLAPAAAQSAIPMGQGKAYETIKRELTSFLGPIAVILCEDYLEDNGQPVALADFQHMITELAEELDEPRQRRDFKARATAALGGQ